MIINYATKYLRSGLLLSVMLGTTVSVAAAEKPNIIYINIDDLGWADVGINGSKYHETPHIDRLAREGMIFSNGYAAAANCAPSRACAITGQYTPRHGVYTVENSDRGDAKDRKLIPTKNTQFIKDANMTFGHALQQAGYATVTIGKWHVSKDPLKNGFDINIGGSSAGGPYSGGYHSPFKYPNLEVKEKGVYLTDLVTDKAIEQIQRLKANPFCIYLPYFMIHGPLQAKAELVEKYKNKKPTATQDNPVYAAMVETMDKNIGRLMQALKDEGVDENTMVIFTSDNGGVNVVNMQTPLRGGKGMYYEGGIREPFFVRWPKVIKAGSVCDTPVTNMDFFPTFCEMAGTTAPKGKVLDGVSLMPLFKGGNIAPRALYWHFPIYLEKYGSATSKAMREARDPLFRTRPGSVIREGDWKLHEYFEDGGLELYNLVEDMSEQKNLAQTHSGKAEELKAMLDAWRKEINAPVPSERNPQYKVVADQLQTNPNRNN